MHLTTARLFPLIALLALACDPPSNVDAGPTDAGPPIDGRVEVPDGGDAGPPEVDAGPTVVECNDTAEVCAGVFEQATADELERLREQPAALSRFLVEMPKGGDLHNHLSGAVYAESYLEWAREADSYCIATGGSNPLALSTSCSSTGREPIPHEESMLFGDVVREWSMLDFEPSAQESGRDHFFSTFGKFGAISGREHGRMLADVRVSASAENVLYIETMLTSNSTARRWGEDVWGALHAGETLNEAAFAGFHAELLADSDFSGARGRQLGDALGSREEANEILACDSATPLAGCEVETRYQAYISRSGSRAGVFGQMVAAYEAAIIEETVVGLNLVGPEDNSSAISQYDIQMAMLNYLESYYEASSPLRLSLHAGELTPAAVPSLDLSQANHIREAVVTAGATRVGHGMDIEYESDPEGLFQLLREREVLVEICLASNDIILEVSGETHPMHDYIANGVPIALATDDPGVARSNMSREHFRAVFDQGIGYLQLKEMARASIDYSFLQGASLWTDRTFASVVDACAPAAGETLASATPTSECQALLDASPRARVEHALEVRYLEFEASR